MESYQKTVLPSWFKQEIPDQKAIESMRGLLKEAGLHTVCQNAHCPNIGECWKNNTATFLILGNICSRSCRFCAVQSGGPLKVNPQEPLQVALAVKKLGLKYVVVTSVTRDDLEDKGSRQFARTIAEIRTLNPDTHIEVLIPDFLNDAQSLRDVVLASPDVIGHNMEMVKRLYSSVRPQALYGRSLAVLRTLKKTSSALIKSGFMVGLGETDEEIKVLIEDLAKAGCDILTVGQYLAPSVSKRHVPVSRYVSLEGFESYRQYALSMGIKNVVSGPLVRSSFLAEKIFQDCHHQETETIYATQ
ncbi:MAG: lipoyl synthase [Candidatus Omnitrophica bacterium]|nr:lipoyl synthase [Candidatus Omnitrophota bacterium]